MNLIAQNYGKQRVRLLKVLRGTQRHEVKELDVGVRLQGDFAAAYSEADNAMVVPTDTMKNTVLALAHEHLDLQTEPFALLLADHFLNGYAQVSQVTIETRERRWNRMTNDREPHPHAFTGDAVRSLSKVTADRLQPASVESGISDLLVMKSTGSGFAGFPRCQYTTLPETSDRVLASLLSASWLWSAPPADYNAANAAIVDAMLRVFALQYSPSVQRTIFEMAGAAFAASLEISRITIAMPNKHYLPTNLAPFGLDGGGVTFVPTDEPHGQIEATISRN